MLKFCLRSLLTEYGWQFICQVALPHPLKTLRAVMLAARRDCSEGKILLAEQTANRLLNLGKALSEWVFASSHYSRSIQLADSTMIAVFWKRQNHSRAGIFRLPIGNARSGFTASRRIELDALFIL
ncbi:MAG: hypothetical protein AB7F40_04785 [Victivallaceae bacterium]